MFVSPVPPPRGCHGFWLYSGSLERTAWGKAGTASEFLRHKAITQVSSTLRGGCPIRRISDFVAKNKHVWLCLYFPLYVILFFTVERLTPEGGYWITDLPIDGKIPFVPQMVWAYCLYFPLFVLVGLPLLIWDGPAFKRWMYYIMTTFTITLVFDALVPNAQGLRPAGFEPENLSGKLLALLWSVDTPTNVFPSMHVLGCVGDAVAALDSPVFSRWQKGVIIVLSAVCAASTVLVKQHAFIDLVGALVFAVPVLLIIYGGRIRSRLKERASGGAAARRK